MRSCIAFICCVSLSLCASDFRLGIENISTQIIKKICSNTSCHIGLITNQTGQNQQGFRTVDILRSKGFAITYLFAPEHGIDGTVEAGKPVADSLDKKTGIPIVSLYEKDKGKTIAADKIHAVDLLIFDIQDAGMRHYTYISTMFAALQAAAAYKKPIIILDRPNPLGGLMEGPLVEIDLQSFISIAPIPVRHGMTIGELAQYFNIHVLREPAPLYVVPMSNYNRDTHVCGLKAQLSPNIKTTQACAGYSFLGMLGEIGPFDVGVGTPVAFQCIVLPESRTVSVGKWHILQQMFERWGIRAIPYDYFNQHKKKYFSGIRLHFANIAQTSSFTILLSVLQFFKKSGIHLSFSPMFDKAIGTTKVRDFLQGNISYAVIAQEINSKLQQFFEQARNSFLYEPLPKPLLLENNLFSRNHRN